MPLMTGAFPSPPHLAFAAVPFPPRPDAPSSYAALPKKLSTWGNTRYGICVSAEECAAKAAYSVAAGIDEVFVTEEEIIDWAWRRGYLHGATLTGPMQSMAKDGVKAEDGKLYHDGPPYSVDWTNYDTLKSAIYTGPVKLGIASSALDGIVTPGKHGWLLSSTRKRSSVDHCVGLLGYGTVAECIAYINETYSLSIPPPSGSDAALPAVIMFTWGSVGVVAHQALVNFTDEAWVRVPTTPDHKAPTDDLPGPPPPGPVIVPDGLVTVDIATKTIFAPSGWKLVIK